MRYTIAKENEVKELAAQGKSSEYISSATGISEKVIWTWCPETRPHDDVIKWSVKQRFHSVIPELEARISSAISPMLRETISEDDWENVNKVIYSTLFDEAIIVFKNLLDDPPEFNNEQKLSKEPFLQYLKNFWDIESDYVKSKKLKEAYVQQSRNSVHYWSLLRKHTLNEINTGDIERVYEQLTSKNLSQSRINSIMKVGLIPLKYAYKKGFVLNRCYEFCLPNPEKSTGVNDQMAVKIFNTHWSNDEAFVANLIAYKCKMQLQEVRALRLEDIQEDSIIIRNYYSNEKGLIPNRNQRKVPSSSFLNNIILRYASTSPYTDFAANNFIFYSENKDKPAHGKQWSSELAAICNKLKIEKISFKNWSK